MLKEFQPLLKGGMKISLSIEMDPKTENMRVLVVTNPRLKVDLPDFKPLTRILSGKDGEAIERELNGAQLLSQLSERAQIISVAMDARGKKEVEKAAGKAAKATTIAAEKVEEVKPVKKTAAKKNADKQIKITDPEAQVENPETTTTSIDAITWPTDMANHLNAMDSLLVIGDKDSLDEWMVEAKKIKPIWGQHEGTDEYKALIAERFNVQKDQYKKQLAALAP